MNCPKHERGELDADIGQWDVPHFIERDQFIFSASAPLRAGTAIPPEYLSVIGSDWFLSPNWILPMPGTRQATAGAPVSRPDKCG